MGTLSELVEPVRHVFEQFNPTHLDFFAKVPPTYSPDQLDTLLPCRPLRLRDASSLLRRRHGTSNAVALVP